MEALTVSGDELISVGAKRTRGLLAILALSDHKPVSRKQITELLWSKRPPEFGRASLRQEVFRLTEACRVFDEPVVQVTRHTLTLVPGLTSVDIDGVSDSTVGIFADIENAGDMLLNEMNGLDPAFDTWLAIKRAIFSRRVQELRKNRSSSLVAASDDGSVLNVPHAGVMEPDDRQGMSDQVSLSTLAAGVESEDTSYVSMPEILLSSEADFAAAAEQQQDAFINFFNAPGAGEDVLRQRAPTLAVIRNGTDNPDLVMLASDLVERVELMMTGIAGLTPVAVSPSWVSSTEKSSDWTQRLLSQGADYALMCTVYHVHKKGDLQSRVCLLRLVDLHRGSQVIWSTRIFVSDSPKENLNEGIVGFLERTVLSLQWKTIFHHASRFPGMDRKKQTPSEATVNGLMTLMSGVYDTGLERLDPAKHSVFSDSIIGIGAAISEVIAACAYFKDDYCERITRARICVQRSANMFVPAIDDSFLLAFISSLTPESMSVTEAVLSGLHIGEAWDIEAEWRSAYLVPLTLLALERGDFESAVKYLPDMRFPSTNDHPLSIVSIPYTVLLAFLLNEELKSVLLGRIVIAVYPQIPSALLYYLVALTSDPESVEKEDILARLLQLDPSLTIGRVMRAHPHLTPGARNKLEKALLQTGLRP